jgi:hypothetical protein
VKWKYCAKAWAIPAPLNNRMARDKVFFMRL